MRQFRNYSSAAIVTTLAPAAQLREIVAAAADPKQLVFIPDSDHFFTGKLEAMQNALGGWINEQTTNGQVKTKVKEQSS